MTRRRWIADEVSGNHAALVGEHANHLARVLRAQIGQQFDISTGENVRRGQVSAIRAGRVEFELGEEVGAGPMLDLTLALAIFKFDRMEWAIEKCVELGVAGIVPVIARRTESHLAAAAPKRLERWQRIARVAAEQSRRLQAPEIAAPVPLNALHLQAATRIVLSEVEQQLSLKNALRDRQQGAIAIAIGPEGGWTEAELSQFQASGWLPVTLGPTIVRVETAAIAAVAIAASELA
jgi:16S rRNA (uracil1498-N3)-methyltransferase